MSIAAWLRERTGGESAPSTVPGPSFAYVAGWVLVMILILEAVTGAALAAFYSPSTTDAWASVAYVQDQMSMGWIVRGLHHHGASALVIIAGLHLVQTAVWGAYKKPREIVWWLGLVLLLLILAFAITGYVLRWDQSGYWANQVEIGIAAGSPVIGPFIKKLALGGNDYGNLTLTRFYALHVGVLPAVVTLLVVGHVVLSRRLGSTPHWARAGKAVARWPQQSLRNVVGMAIAFAGLLAYVVNQHGADLASPADPSSAFDARPLWYFRWLFALRHMAGSAEKLVALAVPALLMGYLVSLPLMDRRDDRAPRGRMLVVGSLLGVFGLIGLLTVMSIVTDMNDEAYKDRIHKTDMQASRLRAIAATNGVPATGPGDLLATQPWYTARDLWAHRCGSCHDPLSKDRKGPIITAGHGSRENIRAFLLAPNSEPFYGKTKLSKTDDAMKPVEIQGADLDAVVEALYAENGAGDADKAKVEAGKKVFADTCSDCHSLDEGVAGTSAPGLGGMRSRDWYTSYIGNPHAAVHMGDKSEMPRFNKELTIVERDLLASWLVYLRTATQADLAKLGPL